MSSQTDAQPDMNSVARHAAERIQFIRRTMERSSTFTAVPGLGGTAMGVVGLSAAIVAATQPSPERWLIVWLGAAAVALVIGVVAMWRKAARSGAPLTGAVGRRFALGLAAPLVAGAAITFALWQQGDYVVMAPTWLLLYGAGVTIGGIFSAPVVLRTGACFMAAGVAAILSPQEWANTWLAVGFGGLQIVFGLHIARHHGG